LITNTFYAWAQEKFKISGAILSSKDSKPVPGAAIQILPSHTMPANDNGTFDFYVTKGINVLKISHVGFKVRLQTFNISQDTSIIVFIEEESILTNEVEIKNSNAIRSEDLGINSLNISQVKKLPSFLGEPDILKIIQFMPGVISAGEGSSAFFVRGGNADENLILLDNAPIYDPSHMLGLFSIFNADIVRSAEMHKNGMPSSYGGRISSLLDVKTNDGNMEKYAGNATLGLMAAKLYLNGPIIKNKLSFAASARRSYVDNLIGIAHRLLPAISTQNSLYFYDLNAKLKYNLNQKNTFTFSVYSGADQVVIGENADVKWGNSFASLMWKVDINRKLQMNSGLVASRFGFDLAFVNGNQNFTWTNQVNEYNLRQDYTYNLKSNQAIKFGFISSYRSISPATYKPLTKGSIINSVEIPTNYSTENAVYLSHNLTVKKWQFDYGFRFSMFTTLGNYNDIIYADPQELILPKVAKVNQYSSFEPIKSFTTPEPRINVGYNFSPNTALKASYNRMAQYIQQVISGITPLPVSFWLPSSTYIKPSVGDNFSLGFTHKLPYNIETSFEAFYKNRTNTIDFVDNAVTFLNPDVITQIRSGTSKAYGAEVFISQASEKLNWNISYTWSKAERNIMGINNDKTYFAPFDRRHSIAALATYELNKKWNFGLSWSFATGRPITLPSGTYQFQQYAVNYITERNGYRMPDYHRLDVSANYKPNPKASWKWYSEWNFSIYNVYNRFNAFAIYTQPTFNSNDQNTNSGNNQAVMLYLFTIVPSISYTVKF